MSRRGIYDSHTASIVDFVPRSFHSLGMTDQGTATDPSTPNGAMTAHTTQMLRAALLRVGTSGANIQDRIDCAELAAAAGAADVARMLYTLVFLHMGFAPDAVEEQRAVTRKSGLWADDLPVGEAAPGARTFSVDVAVSELTDLMRIGGTPTLGDAKAAALSASRPVSSDATLSSTVASIVADMPGLCGALVLALRRPFEEDAAALATLLGELDRRIASGPAIDPRAHVGAPIEVLAALVAYHDLQAFTRRVHCLAIGPTGSAALFHRSARLSRGGLGPYLSNLKNILRRSRDVFALIALAAGDAADDDTLSVWSVLLSSSLEGGQLYDLVEELADLGLVDSLWGILAARARHGGAWQDYGLLQRLRDAGVDRYDWPLAIQAQTIITQIAQHDPGEIRVLADIVAGAGDTARAEALLQDYGRLRPEEATLRLEALRLGDYRDYAITRGVCTPPYRTRLRRAHMREDVAA